jgi:hypothetical protein
MRRTTTVFFGTSSTAVTEPSNTEQCQAEWGENTYWDPDTGSCIIVLDPIGSGGSGSEPPPPGDGDDYDWGPGPDPGDPDGGGGTGGGAGTPLEPPSPEDDCDGFCDEEEAEEALALCRISYPLADLQITEWDSMWFLETGTTFDPAGRHGHYCALMPEIQQTGAMTVTQNGRTEPTPRIITDSFTLEPDGLKMTQGIISGFWCGTLESGSIGLSSVHGARFLYVIRGSVSRSTVRRATDQTSDRC